MTDRRKDKKEDRFQRVSLPSTRVSLVITLINAETNARIEKGPSVRIEWKSDKPQRKPGGFWVVTDLTGNSATVVVDGGTRYGNERKTVTLPPQGTTNQNAYIRAIELQPR